MNYWRHSWPLYVEQCPCDVHFLDYLEEETITGKVIFHFGSGAHHVVGMKCSEMEPPNEVLAVTASREEYEAYIDLVIEKPQVARTYKVLFTDIYTLTPRILPAFDLITLFHLGEFHHPANSAYAPLNDATLVDLMASKLNPDGRLLFYEGSCGFSAAREVLAEATFRGTLVPVGAYKSLLLYAPA